MNPANFIDAGADAENWIDFLARSILVPMWWLDVAHGCLRLLDSRALVVSTGMERWWFVLQANRISLVTEDDEIILDDCGPDPLVAAERAAIERGGRVIERSRVTGSVMIQRQV